MLGGAGSALSGVGANTAELAQIAQNAIAGANLDAAAAGSGGFLGGALKSPLVQLRLMQGIGGALSADDPAAKTKAEYELAGNNYGGGGILSAGNMNYLQQGGPNPTPPARYDPAQYGGRWQWNSATNRIEYVPGG